MPAKIVGHYKTFHCQTCKKECTVWVTPSALKQNKRHEFCSRKCSAARQIRQDIPCGYCGKMFHPIKGARYCSRECFALSTRGRKANNAHPEHVANYILNNYQSGDTSEIAKFLNMTTKTVMRIASKFGVKKKIVKVNRMVGERNPNYRGGVTVMEWGSNWKQQRAKARKRDNYSCQVCGYKSWYISVHHIKRRRLFIGHMEDANNLSNLICLCKTHHLLVEIGKIPCPKPKS